MSGEHVPPHSSSLAPASAARAGSRTWVVVLVTLGCVGAVLVAFVLGIVVGVWVAGRGAPAAAAPVDAPPARTAAPTSPDAAADPGATEQPPDAPPAAADFDQCLVGTWRTIEHSESYDTEQGAAAVTDLDRSIEFTPAGVETITYEQSRATIETEQGTLPAVFDGTVVYNARTSAGTMSFELVSADGSISILRPDGSVQEEQELKPGTGDVTYTCDDDSFVQEAPGYLSAYERVGG